MEINNLFWEKKTFKRLENLFKMNKTHSKFRLNQRIYSENMSNTNAEKMLNSFFF